MISRRAYRPSGAVENLKQLCLNNAAGVNENAPHSNTSTVWFANNLVNNVDGSLSLRKPILMRTCFGSNVTNAIPTGVDGVHLVTGTWNGISGFKLLSEQLVALKYRLVLSDKDGNEIQRQILANEVLPKTVLDLTNAMHTHTGTSVVLSNGLFNLKSDVKNFPGTDLEGGTDTDLKLYDDALYDTPLSGEALYVPRYVQVYFSEEYATWVVKIHCASTNKYTFQNETVTHDMDTLLDNPYAVSDNYNSVAALKTIRTYVESVPQATGVVATNSVTTVQHAHNINVNTTKFSEKNSFEYHKYTDSSSSRITKYYNSSRITKEIPIYSDSYVNIVEFLEVKCDICVSYTGSSHSWNLDYFNLDDCETRLAIRVSDTIPQSKPFSYTVNVPERNYTVKVYFIDSDDSKKYTRQVTLNVPAYSETINNDFFRTLSFRPDFSKNIFYYNIMYVYPQAQDWIYKGQALPALANKSDQWEFSFDTSSVNATVNVVYWDTITTSSSNGNESNSSLRVADLTESTKRLRYRATSTISKEDAGTAIVKAFIGVPPTSNDVYCSWRYTLDGISWRDAWYNPANDEDGSGPDIGVLVEEPSYTPIESVSKDTSELPKLKYNYRLLNATDSSDKVADRVDCLKLADYSAKVGADLLNATAFKFKMCALDVPEEGDPKILAQFGELVYQMPYGTRTEFEQSPFANSATGLKTYSGGRIFSYGNSFKSNILYTYSGEFTTPIYNTITLNATSTESVTAVVPWRDYVVSATSDAMYLSTKSEYGFFTKTATTAVGVPMPDRLCCISVLNGIIFKSGPKIYQLYPDTYSSDDTVLNVFELSKPIASLLDPFANCNGAFAFCTNTEYVLMLPNESTTHCFRYNLSNSSWTYCTYPVPVTSYHMNNVDDVLLYANTASGLVCTYRFDATLSQGLPYGDAIGFDASEGLTSADVDALLDTYYTNNTVSKSIVPIGFELDTGQKTDTISTTKQFVESKLVFATEHGDDSFPMQLVVHIDGDPHIVTKDISTDASFWKDNGVSGVLNTTFNGLSPTSDSFNTLRQLVVRYSGKGKSVRHILTGESLCNFKLYETYIRYKLLNVKQ